VGGLNEKFKSAKKKIDVLLCAAVGTANHQHGLEACTVYGTHSMYVYVYIGFKTFFCVVRPLDSIASYLPTGLLPTCWKM